MAGMDSIAFLVRGAIAVLAAACIAAAAATPGPSDPRELGAAYAQSVDRRLDVPAVEVGRYAGLVEDALARATIRPAAGQYLLAIDRDPQVQALLVLWRAEDGRYELVGAAPVSTGAPGAFDHFLTPLGVFEHGPWNPDFRAEGTLNENGIRGYGAKGMRVFDFGWQRVPKGWGDGAVIEMRLQMHATDPDVLEQRLGSAQSKGCIRIPATVNRFLDLYGVLDANYEQEVAAGRELWVLQATRQAVAGAGRYLVVVDSERSDRPAWSPAPRLPHRRVPPLR
jgi:hypothetical protein